VVLHVPSESINSGNPGYFQLKWRVNTGYPIFSSPVIAPNGRLTLAVVGGFVLQLNSNGDQVNKSYSIPVSII
jgi:hypothetical protein